MCKTAGRPEGTNRRFVKEQVLTGQRDLGDQK